MKDEKKVKRGKVSRAQGNAFELRVRLDLEEKGWVCDKWTNQVEFNIEHQGNAVCTDTEEVVVGKLVKAKPKFVYNPQLKRRVMMGNGSGFPDFICFKLIWEFDDFNIQACGPQNFQELIQFLITQICELQGVTVVPTKEQTCPDCVVTVAECFVTGNQTTMQLVDYVNLIGERICSLITEISLINLQITDILIRVTALENEPSPTFTLPIFPLGCTI